MKKILIVFDAVSDETFGANSLLKESKPHNSVSKIIDDVEKVGGVLKSLGYAVALYDLCGTLKNLAGVVRKEKPDLIFNLAESLGDDAMGEVRVACFFELLEVPYTGSAPYTLASALNKARAKEILNFHKIPTPKYFLARKPSDIDEGALCLPLIIKPACEDGSIGIDERSLVKNQKDIGPAVSRVLKEFGSPAIIEEFIGGKEIHVAILGNENPEVLPVAEIDFSGLPSDYPRILTYDAKWLVDHEAYRGTPVICPARISSDLGKKIKDLSLKVYKVFECRDYARIDFRLDESDQPFVLEVNPNPDISFDDSGFCKAAEAAGLDYTAVIKKIIDSAFERYEG